MRQLMQDPDDQQRQLREDFAVLREDLEAKEAAETKQTEESIKTVKSLADARWLCYMANGNAFCDVCSEFALKLPVGYVPNQSRNSTWTKGNGGVPVIKDPTKKTCMISSATFESQQLGVVHSQVTIDRSFTPPVCEHATG